MSDNDIKKAMEAFKIPEEAEKQIILAAANISGKPQEELTIDQAMEILGGGHPDPVTDAIIDEWSENMGNLLFEDFTDEQFEKLAGQAESGALQENLTKIMEQLSAQDTPFKVRLEPARGPDQKEQAPDGNNMDDIGPAIISDVINGAVSEMISDLDKLFPDARADDNNLVAVIMQELFTTFQKLFSDIPKEYWPYILDLKDLHPYLDYELKDPKYEGVTIEYALKSALAGTRPLEETLFYRLVTAAQFARDKAEGKKGLRTIAKAEDDYTIKKITSKALALITDKDFLNAISLYEQGNAYMKQIHTMDGLKFNDGKLYFTGDKMREVSMVELRNLQTNENIEALNLPFLQFCYSQIMEQWQNAIYDKTVKGGSGEVDPVISFYLPDLAKARGLPANTGKKSVEAIIKDISSFHNVVGVLKVEGFSRPSLYPVLNFEGHDTTKNVISLSSPYLLHVVQTLFKLSVKRNKKGEPRLRNDGFPQTRAINSYLVHSDIQKRRDKAAIQNVFILVQGVERCGKNDIYSIMADTLIKRNPYLEGSLEKNKNKYRVLKRCFQNTWKYLREDTDLQKKYINIKLPDPDDPASIPTPSTLKRFKIVLPHEGIHSEYLGKK